jgi:hypothetical protein
MLNCYEWFKLKVQTDNYTSSEIFKSLKKKKKKKISITLNLHFFYV